MFYIGPVIKCGLIGGGICLSIPSLLHLKVFNDFYEIVDVYKISETDPILDCNQHGLHYKVYLTAKEGEKWDIESAKERITLSLVNVENSNLSWGGTRKSQSEQFNNWGIRITSPKEAVLQIPQKGEAFRDGGYQTLNCQTNKIVSSLTQSGQEVRVVASTSTVGLTSSDQTAIKFELSNSPSCQNNGSRKECEISFNSSNNLKWQDGFKPKAYFYS